MEVLQRRALLKYPAVSMNNTTFRKELPVAAAPKIEIKTEPIPERPQVVPDSSPSSWWASTMTSGPEDNSIIPGRKFFTFKNIEYYFCLNLVTIGLAIHRLVEHRAWDKSWPAFRFSWNTSRIIPLDTKTSSLTYNKEKSDSDESQNNSNHMDDQPWDEETTLFLFCSEEEENVGQHHEDPQDQWHPSISLIFSLSPLGPELK